MLVGILIGLAALFVVASIVAVLVGSRLPAEHVAQVVGHVPRAPADVWTILTDFQGQVGWAPGMKKVERLPDQGGHEVWREHFGPRPVTVATTQSQAPSHLVRTIVDDGGPFSGRWDYLIEKDGDGTRVTITEHGRVPSAVARFFVHKVFGTDHFLKRYMAALTTRAATAAPGSGAAPFTRT